MNGSFGISFLSILSFIVSLVKEVAIIFLLVKIVQLLNIFIKNREIPFMKVNCKNDKPEENKDEE